ncbi:MAG: hypothetical protein JNM20_11555 [Rhizobiales bacterium]|nr:hypothetical protein [Hyphomicrobiales bacterium]
MARKRSVKSELGDLQAELHHAAGAEQAAGAAEPPPPGESETVLRELESALGKAGEDAEDLVARHPLAAVAAAFLLGILVGRIMGR